MVADFQTKKLSMYRTPIYIINHVIFFAPPPRKKRKLEKKFGSKCAFLLEWTVRPPPSWHRYIHLTLT